MNLSSVAWLTGAILALQFGVAFAQPSNAGLLDELTRRPRNENQATQYEWLKDRLRGATLAQLSQYHAALDGACVSRCPIGLQYARANIIGMESAAKMDADNAIIMRQYEERQREIADNAAKARKAIDDVLSKPPAQVNVIPPQALPSPPPVDVVPPSPSPPRNALRRPSAVQYRFNNAVVLNLEGWSRPVDEIPSWLASQVATLHTDELQGLQAEMAGRCSAGCPAPLLTGRLVIDNLIARRVRDEDKNLRVGDRWTTMLSAIIGAVAGGLAGALGTAFVMGRQVPDKKPKRAPYVPRSRRS